MAKVVKTLNLSNLEGVYDVTINKAAPSARRQRQASKAPATAKSDSLMYDDARERAMEYGYDPDAKLPIGFFG